MIKLVFTIGREAVSFEIKNMIIKYRDRRFSQGIRILPMQEDFERMVIMCRNRIPKEIVELIRDCNKGKNLEEYQNAKDEEDLVIIIKKDAILKGCVFQKRIDIPEEDTIEKDNSKDIQKEDTSKINAHDLI